MRKPLKANAETTEVAEGATEVTKEIQLCIYSVLLCGFCIKKSLKELYVNIIA